MGYPKIKYMFSAMIHKIDEIVEKTKTDLEVKTFGINDIKKLIKIISKENNNQRLIEDYKNKNLKCSICNKNISVDKSEFGGVIKDSQNRWILLCRDLNCYNKALSE